MTFRIKLLIKSACLSVLSALPVLGTGTNLEPSNTIETETNTPESRFIPFQEGITSLKKTDIQDLSNLVKIIIPSSVTQIESQLFAQAPLESVEFLPNSHLGTLSKQAFTGCLHLKDVSLPESLRIIQDQAFAFSGLQKIVLPSSVQHIETGAFEKSNLESIEFASPSRMRNLGACAFSNCSKLKQVTLPEGVVILGSKAFLGTDLRQVIIPRSVQLTGSSLFEESSLESIEFSSPSQIIAINLKTFYKCRNLHQIQIPSSVIMIKAGAFCESGLRRVVVPENVQLIEKLAFGGCLSLEEASIENPYACLELGIFALCPSLRSLTLPRAAKLDNLGLIPEDWRESHAANLREGLVAYRRIHRTVFEENQLYLAERSESSAAR